MGLNDLGAQGGLAFQPVSPDYTETLVPRESYLYEMPPCPL